MILINQKGMKLQISPVGATWLSCQLPLTKEVNREVLLRCQNPHDNSDAYIGATIGRYCNRIKNAVIQNKDSSYQLKANQDNHQLHGGKNGFHTKVWQILTQQTNRLIFGLISPDGDEGFPGQVKATVDYLLTENNQVVINYIATTDKCTSINLTNHAYFNLDGKGDILNHQLSVDADYYLPVDKSGIPQNHLLPVAGSDMDLRTLQPLGTNLLQGTDKKQAKGYDHAYLLNRQNNTLTKSAAKLVSSDKQVTMEVFTNKPAIQVYTGNNLCGINGDKGVLSNYQGIALETEFLPDSPNRPDWPHESCWFEPSQFYCYTTIYQFVF